MKIVFTAAASRSLEAITAYIERESPPAAERLVEALLEKIQTLVDFPQSYPVVPRYGEAVRMMPLGRYLVLYRIASDRIVIRHIVHGARDVERLLRLPRRS